MNISADDVMKVLIFISSSLVALAKIYINEVKKNSEQDRKMYEERILALEKKVDELSKENKELHNKLLEEVKSMLTENK